MKSNLTVLIKSNWFLVALICFVIVLPLSQALVSVFSGVLLFVAIVEDNWTNKLNRIKQRKIILLIPLIFLLYLLSTLFSLKNDRSFYDVQKTLFYLVLPLAFTLGKEVNSKQKRMVLYVFASSVFLATLIAIFNWKFLPTYINFSIHQASLISHIRFSFQLILVFWFLVFMLFRNYQKISKISGLGHAVLAVYILFFLFFQQSLTGIIAFGGSVLFIVIYAFYTVPKNYKKSVVFIGGLFIVLPLLYVGGVIYQFYDIEKVSPKTILKTTERGNLYQHDFTEKAVENGKYVFLYICESEMRDEWNKVSELKYDSIGKNGYPVSSTLIRYLTSKGVHKDGEGVLSLSKQDIANIENGMANVIFQRKFSIYPRIYQTVWEYYTYTTTGYVNHQSFSQRIEFAKAAVKIIKEHFWFGVGTGNWKSEFANAFKQSNSQLDESLYASSHDQYLNYTVKFGFLGFLFIMFAIVYPIIKTRRYRDALFLIFLVFMFFSNFADSNLESHMGSSFFFFFYSFFISTNGIDYLKIDKS